MAKTSPRRPKQVIPFKTGLKGTFNNSFRKDLNPGSLGIWDQTSLWTNGQTAYKFCHTLYTGKAVRILYGELASAKNYKGGVIGQAISLKARLGGINLSRLGEARAI